MRSHVDRIASSILGCVDNCLIGLLVLTSAADRSIVRPEPEFAKKESATSATSASSRSAAQAAGAGRSARRTGGWCGSV